MAKRQKHEEHENHERWLVSYADFITLLFAFFVVMYAVSRVDQKRLTQTVESIRWALHLGGKGGVTELPIFDGPLSAGGSLMSTGSSGYPSPKELQAVEVLRQRLEKRLRPFLREQQRPAVVMSVEPGRLSVRLAASRFFDASRAALRPEVLPVLDAIAHELVPLSRPIRVEGHTDDSPLESAALRNNWDLSVMRASTVVSYLERAHRVPPKLLQAAGFAGTRPIAPNATPDGREANRRIEMVVEVGAQDPLGVAVR